MAQRSFFWDGASLGDAGALTVHDAAGIGYALANVNYESLLVDVAFRMLWNGDGNRGVLRGWGNELEVTGAATPVQVDTGGAVVYGMPYESQVAVNVAVPTPVNDTRHDRLVLRRDWTAQTVRITRLPGAEGGGLPALTQSPAPAGSGVYDVPLAALEVTTGGAIAVTDEREFCAYGTSPGTDSFAEANLQDDSIDLNDRATRTRRWFVGAGDMAPLLAAAQFFTSGTTITATGTAGWGGGGNVQGWQLTGSAYEGAIATLTTPPPGWAAGNVLSYIWWAANSSLTPSFAIGSALQGYSRHVLYTHFGAWHPRYATSSVWETDAIVANTWYRTQGATIPEVAFTYYRPTEVIHYLAYWYNAAGAEDINLLGVEFVYTGYV